MSDDAILAAARAAITGFGLDAVRILEERSKSHREAGEREGESFWAQAAVAARQILAGHRRPDITPSLPSSNTAGSSPDDDDPAPETDPAKDCSDAGIPTQLD